MCVTNKMYLLTYLHIIMNSQFIYQPEYSIQSIVHPLIVWCIMIIISAQIQSTLLCSDVIFTFGLCTKGIIAHPTLWHCTWFSCHTINIPRQSYRARYFLAYTEKNSYILLSKIFGDKRKGTGYHTLSQNIIKNRSGVLLKWFH